VKVLITGGNGFIASHLAEKMIEKGLDVTLMDITYGKNTQNIDCEKIIGDVRRFPLVKDLVRKADTILHFAAVSRVEWGQAEPIKCWEINTLGTLNVLEALRKVNRFGIILYASSREVYGEPIYLPVTEEHPRNPISVYGVSKLASESLIEYYHQVYELNYVIIRFSNVYGSPRDLPDRVIPKFMRLAMINKPLVIYGGKQVLDFTFIDDVTDGLLSAVEKAVEGNRNIINNAFHFTSGKGMSIFQLAELILEICHSQSKIHIKKERRHDVSMFVGDFRKAAEKIGYSPKHSLPMGLKIYKNRLKDVTLQ